MGGCLQLLLVRTTDIKDLIEYVRFKPILKCIYYRMNDGLYSTYICFYRGKTLYTKLILRKIPKKSGQYFLTFCRILPNPAIKATSVAKRVDFY